MIKIHRSKTHTLYILDPALKIRYTIFLIERDRLFNWSWLKKHAQRTKNIYTWSAEFMCGTYHAYRKRPSRRNKKWVYRHAKLITGRSMSVILNYMPHNSYAHSLTSSFITHFAFSIEFFLFGSIGRENFLEPLSVFPIIAPSVNEINLPLC